MWMAPVMNVRSSWDVTCRIERLVGIQFLSNSAVPFRVKCDKKGTVAVHRIIIVTK